MRSLRPRSRFWLPISILCAVLVLGLLLFEVLDVDGSDSPRLPRSATAKLLDPPQNDGRRSAVIVPALDPAGDVGVRLAPPPSTRLQPRAAAAPSRQRPPRVLRAALARAVLGDGPAAA
jgi:hypothetical protein